MSHYYSRREFAKSLGIGAGALPFLLNLESLAGAVAQPTKQRLIVVFSPNGVIPPNFWPDEEGENFNLKRIMAPLEPFKNR